MEKVNLWCSPHTPTEEQMTLGQVRLLENVYPELQDKLSNITLESDLVELAQDLISFAGNTYDIIQPGGSPAFQCILGKELLKSKNHPNVLYSFSKRVSEDILQKDGTIKKVSIFKHEGWVMV